ncbi:hypothetical protein LWI28_017505 [Acer negundo]|uniref:Uncharacterized protein n=1 Tax=Acer negundo TaxID=4023 RepID=A0AAD5JTJ7_ACENE|nr:hypothetical protein LWI28_017505 [Acer negundo]KAK4857799.1 hypothetical protein QYF36_006448 [Acer negundo]
MNIADKKSTVVGDIDPVEIVSKLRDLRERGRRQVWVARVRYFDDDDDVDEELWEIGSESSDGGFFWSDDLCLILWKSGSDGGV